MRPKFTSTVRRAEHQRIFLSLDDQAKTPSRCELQPDGVFALQHLYGFGYVRDARADLAVGPDCRMEADVLSTPLFDTNIVLVCRPDHVLMRKKTVTWRDVRQQPLVVVHHESLTYPVTDAVSQEHFIVTAIVNQTVTAMALVVAGVGVMLARAFAVDMVHRYGLMQRLVCGPTVTCRTRLYEPATRPLSPAAALYKRRLLEHCREQGAEPIDDRHHGLSLPAGKLFAM